VTLVTAPFHAPRAVMISGAFLRGRAAGSLRLFPARGGAGAANGTAGPRCDVAVGAAWPEERSGEAATLCPLEAMMLQQTHVGTNAAELRAAGLAVSEKEEMGAVAAAVAAAGAAARGDGRCGRGH